MLVSSFFFMPIKKRCLSTYVINFTPISFASLRLLLSSHTDAYSVLMNKKSQVVCHNKIRENQNSPCMGEPIFQFLEWGHQCQPRPAGWQSSSVKMKMLGKSRTCGSRKGLDGKFRGVGEGIHLLRK